MVKMIFAVEEATGLIGDKHDLPWRFKEDLKFFRETTEHKIVLCGRSTFDSIPELPGRSTVVVTHDRDFRRKSVKRADFVVDDLDDFFTSRRFDLVDIFIIGGSSIYEQAAKYADEIIVTSIKPPKGMKFEGDSYIFDYRKDFKYEETLDKITCKNLKDGKMKDVMCELTMQRWVRKNS